jgi:Predicted ATPase (AAA+ superfamily)
LSLCDGSSLPGSIGRLHPIIMGDFICYYWEIVYLCDYINDNEMITQEQIAGVIDSQWNVFLRKDTGLRRDALNRLPIIETYATIVTGIRRCGKSTLLLQLLKEKFGSAIYLNFEDTRLAVFLWKNGSRENNFYQSNL